MKNQWIKKLTAAMAAAAIAVTALAIGDSLENACRAQRLPSFHRNADTDLSMDHYVGLAMEQWGAYPNTGYLFSAVEAQLTLEQTQEGAALKNNLTTYVATEIPAFIRGEQDITDDATWQAYVDGLDAFAPDTYCDWINTVLGK